LAAEAELAAKSGYAAYVIALYTQAAEAETHAISQLDITKKRTLSITVVIEFCISNKTPLTVEKAVQKPG
jgi:hypothetical protein